MRKISFALLVLALLLAACGAPAASQEVAAPEAVETADTAEEV